MTSFDRIKSALEHREGDRVPFDLGGSVLTGINRHAYRKLRSYLGLPVITENIYDPMQQLARVDDDVLTALGVDVDCVDPGAPTKPGHLKAPWRDGPYWRMTDELGIGWKMPVDNGHYYDMTDQPLKDAETPADVDAFDWPDPRDPGRFATMKARADKAVFQDKKAYVLGRHFAGIWETALWMCGFEKFFADMMVNEEFAHALMERITEQKMAYWETALATVGDNVLVISEADDLATQNSLLVSPDLYKELVHPYHKRLFSHIKAKAKNKVYIFYHSCGAVKPMIPLLIEEGVDILNPVQVNAAGMGDTAALKREFGKDLTFWGGGVDTQHVLPFGTPAQVKDEVKRRIDDLAPGGGFVFAAVHNVQGDVPPENFMAMWETLQEAGKY